MINYYGLVFKDGGKVYYFSGQNLNVAVNDRVIVETEKGLQIAKCVKTNIQVDNNIEVKSIIRIADSKDIDKYEKNLMDAEKALNNARKIIAELGLEMNLIESSFTFDKKQLLITYVADSRVDFRELAKKLAGIYRTRIELHQIGPRDKAKEVGGFGVCGRELCCVKTLKHMDSVGMNMAKNQGLALNPNKINGSCGRLLCCLAYEDEEYARCQTGLPNVGQTVKTKEGMGKVISVDILKRKYSVLIEGNVVTIEAGNERN